MLPHVCGMAQSIRRRRLLFIFRAFFDETTDDKNIFMMAGWLGHFEEWEEFSNAWARELKFEPCIEYFNHNDAMGLKGEFKHLSAEDRDAKVMNLASLVARFGSLVGIVGEVNVPEHSRLFSGSIVPKRMLRTAIRMIEPYHVACQCAIAFTIGYQAEIAKNLKDPVDFIFDDGVPYLDDCIANIPKLKNFLPKKSLPIFGTVLPGNDKSVVALQASDLL